MGSNNNGNKGDTVKAAIFMQLSNEKSDSESDEQYNQQFWEDDDSVSDDNDATMKSTRTLIMHLASANSLLKMN